MRKFLFGMLIAATAASPAFAQNDDHRDHGGDHHGQQAQPQHQQGQHQQGQHQQGQRQGGRPEGQRPQGQVQQQFQQRQQFQPQQQQQQERNFGNRNWQGQRGDGNFNRGPQGQTENFRRAPDGNRGVAPEGNRFQQRQNWQGREQGRQEGWRGDQNWRGQNGRGGARWDRGWRNNGRYDWQRYRASNRRIFHLGPYYAPYRGYAYSRLEVGLFLDSLFFDQNYWIDSSYYDLPPAPPGAEWVRYYNDVVLVDMESGQVIDVIYDFFW